MRLLGIDYGEKRVGIAVSDEEQQFAFAKVVLQNSKKLLEEVAKLCIENEIVGIVIGDSRDYEMKENKIMEKITPFIEELRLKTKLPVELELEFMTSIAADRFQGKNEFHDASAAALILQSYLDKKLAQKPKTI
jgi:putative Holliday junction resolvase